MLQETAVLLYFGLSFLWIEVEARGRVPGDIWFMKELDAGNEAQDTFKKAVLNDLKVLKRANFTTKNDVRWTGTRFFKRVERSNLWVYQHATHVNCSSATYENFTRCLKIQKKPTALARGCQHKEHYALEAFFNDNCTLQHIYADLLEDSLSTPGRAFVETQQALLEKVLSPSATSTVDSTVEQFSTVGAPTECGTLFTENTWTQRLCGSLRLYLPQRLSKQVMYTAEDASQFSKKQTLYTGLSNHLAACYPFHGSPDLTIKSVALVYVDETSESSDESSDTSAETATVEVGLQMRKQCHHDGLPPKLGELLAAMHVCLVKKVLRAFIQKGKCSTGTMETRGLFLHKAIGGILCILRIPLTHGENFTAAPEVVVDEFGCHLLTTSYLCKHLQRLLLTPLHELVF